jgi:PKHD-type hydroxylase
VGGYIPWLNRGPLVVENLLTGQLCDELLAQFKTGAQRPRSYQGLVDSSRRNCDYVEVSRTLADIVADLMCEHVDGYFGVQSCPIEQQPQLIYRYGQGVGFVTHHDEVTGIELERATYNSQPVIAGDLTTVLFLNGPNEYGSGALYFEYPQLELRPSKGTLVAFPATRDFMHGVRPIEHGERFTLLARRAVMKANQVSDAW